MSLSIFSRPWERHALTTFAFAALTTAGSALAQTTGNGSITGTVTDTSGARIPKARVTVTEASTHLQRSTVTNAEGLYVLPALRLGTYSITAESEGMALTRRNDVVLDADSTRSVDLIVSVGNASDAVTVTAAPPSIENASGALGGLISGIQITELPLNGRNFSQLLTLGTGVSSSQTGLRMGSGQEGNPLLSINGGRQNANAFTFDGVLAMDTGGNRGINLFPPPEAIGEIQVHTSNYTADIGSYGYGQVNVVTRTGGASYHGDVYDVFANDALNAKNFFNTQKPPLKDNNFGYDIGGPIVPGAKSGFGRGLFFFFSQAWDKRSGPELTSFTSPPQSTFTGVVPTVAMRSGDFSAIATPLRNPSTGLPFAGNRITNIDPNALILLNTYIPLPTNTAAAAGSTNWVASPKSRTEWREELARVDVNFGERDSLLLRYAHDSWSQSQAILKPSNHAFTTIGGNFSKPGSNTVVQWTHIFGPHLVNQAIAGYSRNQITQSPNAAAQRPAGLNIPSLFNANVANVIPSLSFGGGYSGIGAQGLTNNTNNVFTYRDDLTYQLGVHTLKAGLNTLRIQKFDRFPYAGQAGTFTFDGSVTGNAIADFLTGRAFSYSEQGTIPNAYLFSNMYEGYLQDTWKVRQNLTVDYGVRDTVYTGAPNGYEKYDRISTFIPSLYVAANAPTVLQSNGALVSGTGEPTNGLITPTNQKGLHYSRALSGLRNNIGPRVGFAYTPGKAGRTAIRGGFGIFYHWDNDNHENGGQNPPFSQSGTAFGVALSSFGNTSATTFPATLNVWDPRKLYATISQYSLTVEQQLPVATTLSISYVGNQGRHLDQTPNINQLQPGQLPASGTNVNYLRPYKGYAAINYDVRSASANYNALQVNLRRRFQHGLSFGVAYTWSRAQVQQVGQSQFFNERGLGSYDRTNILALNYVWQPNYFRNGNFAERMLLANWELSGITNFQSGLPFTASTSTDVARVGNTGQRPNRIGAIAYRPRSVSNYFSASSFTAAAPGTFGTERLGDIRGPGTHLWQMNVAKNIPIERVSLKFEAQFYNIFNHANFNGVGVTYGSAAFGTLNSALDPRNIQFRLKASF
ncbi:TonB-dependent receptor [Terriglobus roseus]|uniref:TonB-dependent Receptor Plug Domain n=1 Tax=Terriglobus roseus TaxID=392734 RepID=A0A1H4JZU6_9BACT|nr:carboxypeptidase regulatory-like domain-containing protein [Terriglobus roseus]SEB51365.1 TonB-dependent Receptor Plug Domain [Terriglobus roseus]